MTFSTKDRRTQKTDFHVNGETYCSPCVNQKGKYQLLILGNSIYIKK